MGCPKRGKGIIMIEVNNLNVWFGPKNHRLQVIKDVSFKLNEGESFGLVGESGSGKSTILRTIMGLVPHWDGEIFIDGQDIRTAGRKQFLQTIQMVFQDPYASLHPRYVIGEAIEEPMRINRIPNAKNRTIELLEAIGLKAEHRFRFPHELSGGQRQRVAIARALSLNPKILLLDEPTSALDVSIQAEVLNLLNELKEKLGLTFIIVSHDLAVISYMCDRLAIMAQGEIVEIMDRDALRNNQAQKEYSKQLIEASY
jgi:peptide/nickel transport system ATP-binding protein